MDNEPTIEQLSYQLQNILENYRFRETLIFDFFNDKNIKDIIPFFNNVAQKVKYYDGTQQYGFLPNIENGILKDYKVYTIKPDNLYLSLYYINTLFLAFEYERRIDQKFDLLDDEYMYVLPVLYEGLYFKHMAQMCNKMSNFKDDYLKFKKIYASQLGDFKGFYLNAHGYQSILMENFENEKGKFNELVKDYYKGKISNKDFVDKQIALHDHNSRSSKSRRFGSRRY